MFGVKVYQRRDLVEGLTRVLINFGHNQKYDTDQILLSKIFWPSVKHDVVTMNIFTFGRTCKVNYIVIIGGSR
jgi:hypothetical protein